MPVSVARGDASRLQLTEHRSRVEPEAVTHLCKRVAGLVEANHFIDLLRCRRGVSPFDALSLQDSADRHSMAVVLGGKLVNRLSRLIGGDDPADFLVRESRLRRALTTTVRLRKLADWLGREVTVGLPQFFCMRGEQYHVKVES